MVISVRRRTWVTNEDDGRKKLDLLLEEGVATLYLGVRTINSLERVGIITVRDLLMKRPSELLEIENFGTKSLREIYAALARVGLERTQGETKEMAKKKAATKAPAKKSAATAAKRAAPAPAKKAPAEPKLLTAEQALTRCIEDLYIIKENLFGEDPDSELGKNLQWITSYATSRKPYPAETPAPAAVAVAEEPEAEEEEEESEAAPVEEDLVDDYEEDAKEETTYDEAFADEDEYSEDDDTDDEEEVDEDDDTDDGEDGEEESDEDVYDENEQVDD